MLSATETNLSKCTLRANENVQPKVYYSDGAFKKKKKKKNSNL